MSLPYRTPPVPQTIKDVERYCDDLYRTYRGTMVCHHCKRTNRWAANRTGASEKSLRRYRHFCNLGPGQIDRSVSLAEFLIVHVLPKMERRVAIGKGDVVDEGKKARDVLVWCELAFKIIKQYGCRDSREKIAERVATREAQRMVNEHTLSAVASGQLPEDNERWMDEIAKATGSGAPGEEEGETTSDSESEEAVASQHEHESEQSGSDIVIVLSSKPFAPFPSKSGPGRPRVSSSDVDKEKGGDKDEDGIVVLASGGRSPTRLKDRYVPDEVGSQGSSLPDSSFGRASATASSTSRSTAPRVPHITALPSVRATFRAPLLDPSNLVRRDQMKRMKRKADRRPVDMRKSKHSESANTTASVTPSPVMHSVLPSVEVPTENRPCSVLDSELALVESERNETGTRVVDVRLKLRLPVFEASKGGIAAEPSASAAPGPCPECNDRGRLVRDVVDESPSQPRSSPSSSSAFGVILLYLNVQGLTRSKFDDLFSAWRDLKDNGEPVILILSETHRPRELSKELMERSTTARYIKAMTPLSSAVVSAGASTSSAAAAVPHRGGGMMLLVPTRLSLLTMVLGVSPYSVTFSINTSLHRQTPVIVHSVYLPPSMAVENCKIFYQPPGKLEADVILGDINVCFGVRAGGKSDRNKGPMDRLEALEEARVEMGMDHLLCRSGKGHLRQDGGSQGRSSGAAEMRSTVDHCFIRKERKELKAELDFAGGIIQTDHPLMRVKIRLGARRTA